MCLWRDLKVELLFDAFYIASEGWLADCVTVCPVVIVTHCLVGWRMVSVASQCVVVVHVKKV